MTFSNLGETMQNIDNDLRKNQYKLLIAILMIVFLSIVGYTVYWEINYYSKYNHFKKVTAEVVAYEVDGDKKYDVLEYVVNSSYYQNITSYESKNKIGDKISIYYDTNNPLGVIYSRDYRRYVLPIICVLLGVVCSSFVVIYKKSFPKQKLDKNKSTMQS